MMIHLDPTGSLWAAKQLGERVDLWHSCGLTENGQAFCWGSGANGRLGDGSGQTRLTLVPVAGGISFSWISPGEDHSCGVSKAGDAFCWCLGNTGALGTGTTESHSTPFPVSGGLIFKTPG